MSSPESGRGVLGMKALAMKDAALQELAQRDACAPPPYDYDEFARRRDRAVAWRRATGWAAAASVAALGVLIGLSLQGQDQGLTVRVAGPATAAPEVDEAAPDAAEPALVDVGRTALRDELEDRIAWFDAALSTGGAEALPDAELMQLQWTREQLATSLQHVTYAHALLDY
ncbi:MAG: hypothetical protein QM696_07630 [Steroidobacteraceae bacterium]